MTPGIRAERLFAELCSEHFLQGFVFHSPRFVDQSEKEAGDIVLWVRRQVIVFEVISRDAMVGNGTKSFVKRIGTKRDQLLRDFEVFRDQQIDIHLTNEHGEKVLFDKPDIGDFGFAGIVIVDCDSHLERVDFGTLKKSLAMPFPVAIMTLQDFLDLTAEVDTIPDLMFYLLDRNVFLKCIFDTHPQRFLDLNCHLERNLIAYYKTNDNAFPTDGWNSENALGHYSIYLTSLNDRILARDEENAGSFIIDRVIDFLRINNEPSNSTLLHSWELASMTRRQRAGWLSNRIEDAFQRLRNGKRKRHFAFFNQATGCWLVFYFQNGGGNDEFKTEAEKLTRYKLWVEMKQRAFEFSVFCYAFRKIDSGNDPAFDEVMLLIEDAQSHSVIPDSDFRRACEMFGKLQSRQITEFPN